MLISDKSLRNILLQLLLKETTGGEFRVYRASIRYIDLQKISYNGNYPPENVLDIIRKPTGLNNPDIQP